VKQVDINVQGINHTLDSKFNSLNILVKNEISRNSLSYFMKESEFLFNSINDKIFYYIIRRLIYIGKFVKTKGIFDSTIIFERDEIKNILIREFNISSTNLDEIINTILILIDEISNNNISGKLNKPKSHKGAMHKYALENNLRCYICGSEVDYYNKEAKNYREFEHLIPRSLGGNKTNKNIFIACAECNRAKRNYLNWVETEFSVKHNIFYNRETDNKEDILHIIDNMEDVNFEKELLIEEKMETKINKDLIFIVSSMYGYKCSMCEVDNDISDKTYIIKKEQNDYCHPLNLMTICDKCLLQIDSNWVDTNNYIARIRISNVGN